MIVRTLQFRDGGLRDPDRGGAPTLPGGVKGRPLTFCATQCARVWGSGKRIARSAGRFPYAAEMTDLPDPAEAFRSIRGQTRGEELQSHMDIKMLLDRIPRFVSQAEKLSKTSSTSGSELDVDDSVTNPIQLSHLVTYCQLVAIDNLRAVREILNPDGGDVVTFPIVAVYPLLRSVMESSSLALWILESDDQSTRVTRLLRARATDIVFDDQLTGIVLGPLPTTGRAERSEWNKATREAAAAKKRRRGYIQAIADELGVPMVEIDQGTPGFGELNGLAAARSGIPEEMGRAVWHYISGLTHPSPSRGASASALDEVGPKVANILNVRVTANLGQVHLALIVAMHHYRRADQLLRFRMLKVAARN